jgi:hypothetical protein
MQQYADECAAYGLQTIGCGPSGNPVSYTAINSVTPPGMGIPESWGCNANNKLHAKTGWTSVAFLKSRIGMAGVTAEGGYDYSPDAGYAPVCALAH